MLLLVLTSVLRLVESKECCILRGKSQLAFVRNVFHSCRYARLPPRPLSPVAFEAPPVDRVTGHVVIIEEAQAEAAENVKRAVPGAAVDVAVADLGPVVDDAIAAATSECLPEAFSCYQWL